MKMNAFPRLWSAALALLVSLAGARAEDPQSAVSGVKGVKQDAVDRIKSVEPNLPPPPQAPPPPPPAVAGVAGVKQDAVEQVKPVTQAPPPPPQAPLPPPPAVAGVAGVKQDAVEQVKPVTQAPPPPPPPVSAVTSGGSIQAVNGVGGLDAAKLRNLEAALILKQANQAPPSDGAEHSGKGKAAAAALLAAPLEKLPAKPKEDGRAGFHEFEKLQNRGS